MKSTAIALVLLFVPMFSGHAQSMGHWEALAQIETDVDDNKVGASGERSRYQITEKVWYAHTGWPFTDATNCTKAYLVADVVMEDRTSKFRILYKHDPSNWEWYVLWNKPSVLLPPYRGRLSNRLMDRAGRFANLCEVPK